MLSLPKRVALLTLLLLTGLALGLIQLMQPPKPLPATAPTTEFSAERAFVHVKAMSVAPHAMGTAAHASVRAYLLDQMRALGLNPQVQETPVAGRRGGSVGYVYNLLGRLRGQQPGKVALLMAHYDSQPNAIGAADDASSVAAILETVRALRAGPPLPHDVIVLITDGEEYGLYGPQAFLRHPWAGEVGFVMNLEARGTRGPSMTFEISPQNGWAVEAFAKAAPYPLASSLMYEIYRSLPNNTDFTIFRNAGYTGINSAYIDGFVHYHKLTDSPENLDLGSMQHHGSNLLAMTRYVASQSLEQTKAPDKIFFNTLGYHFVQYPMAYNWGLVALLTAVLAFTLATALRKKVLTVGQTLAGAGLFLLMLILILALFWPITVGVRAYLPPAYHLTLWEGPLFSLSAYINGIYGSDRFLVAYTLLTVGVFGLLTRLVLRWIRPFAFVMGVYFFLYGLILWQAVALPSVTFQLLFPLLFSALGTLLVLRSEGYQRRFSPKQALLGVLTMLPTLLLIPLVRLLFVTFDLQLPIVIAVLGLVITLGLLLPLGLRIEQELRWRNGPTVPLLALVAGLALTVWAVRAEAPSATQPLHSHVSYYLDADAGRAYWATESLEMDPWKKQFFATDSVGLFKAFYPATGRRRRWSEGRALAIPAPTAELLRDSSTATGRTVQLRLRSVRGAAGFEIGLLTPDTTTIRSVRINNEPVKPTVASAGQQTLSTVVCHGLPVNKEMTLTVQLRPGASFQLLLYDESNELPADLIRVPRPAEVVFEQGRGSNQTVVRKRFQF
ncbi:M28 family peptidase [Rudanella lutea]|uniref:M28 family peptidase n=1 Tax=Rudanella lutea TaxID=451374 RepID=UPI0003735CDC|nr:M28 family peptidase [Rudanella lutea]